MRVVVTGAAGSVGRRVVAQLHGRSLTPQGSEQSPGSPEAAPSEHVPEVDVVAVDVADMSRFPQSVTTARIDLETDDLSGVLNGAHTVVHLASKKGAPHEAPAVARSESALLSRLLESMTDAGVGHLVVMSSAAVYGAWPHNPVPLTEESPAQPNPEFSWAVSRHHLEELARRWSQQSFTAATPNGNSSPDGESSRTGESSPDGKSPLTGESSPDGESSPGGKARGAGEAPERAVSDRDAPARRTVAIMRPAPVVATDRLGNLARALWSARQGLTARGDVPVQYLHADDMASAVVTVVLSQCGGVVNVAPDGWIAPHALADLEGPRPRLRVRPHTMRYLNDMRVRLGFPPKSEAMMAYIRHPWVITNHRLRTLGWTPTHTNEEAWVVSHEPGPLESLSAPRRQKLMLGVAGGLLLSALAGIGWLIARLRGRR